MREHFRLGSGGTGYQLFCRKHGYFGVADWNGDGSLGSARVSRAVFGVSPNTSQTDLYQENVRVLQGSYQPIVVGNLQTPFCAIFRIMKGPKIF
jgi:hypothetical protein